MKTLWIILLVFIGLFLSYFIASLFMCKSIDGKKWKEKICYRVLSWKNIKNFYKESYKVFYVIISGIILFVVLLFLISIVKDYYSFVFSNQTKNNINKTIAYFIPQKDTINCLTLNADSFYLVKPNKDTVNLTKCNQVPQDTAKRMVFIINGNNKCGETGSISNKLDPENSKGTILEDTSNIIGHTSNLLTYITIFFAIIGILGGIGLYKYVTTINNLEKETERLKNKTLDAGLTTIAAVPLVEATQITSYEYNLAIETITNSIVENRENIEKNPKYSRLLIVEALHYWNLRDYGQAAHILEKALKLAYRGGEDDTVKTIYYHLARVYKQWGFENKNKRKKYFDKAEGYAKNTFPEQKKVINLSIASILYDKEKNDDNNKNLLTEIKKCIGIGESENLSITDEIKDFASWTAFTVTALFLEKDSFSEQNIEKEKLQKHYAEQSLLLLEEEIHSLAGSNIKASWYNTMSQLAVSDDKKNTYIKLAKFYQKKSKNLYILDPILLVEDELDLDKS